MTDPSYTYRLPWPPSANTMWRRAGNFTYLTKKGHDFREAVAEIVGGDRPELTGRLRLSIELIAPDRRKRDIDNHIKAICDAMEAAGVFLNDEQIDCLIVQRLHVEPPGAADVVVVEAE